MLQAFVQIKELSDYVNVLFACRREKETRKRLQKSYRPWREVRDVAQAVALAAEYLKAAVEPIHGEVRAIIQHLCALLHSCPLVSRSWLMHGYLSTFLRPAGSPSPPILLLETGLALDTLRI